MYCLPERVRPREKASSGFLGLEYLLSSLEAVSPNTKMPLITKTKSDTRFHLVLNSLTLSDIGRPLHNLLHC